VVGFGLDPAYLPVKMTARAVVMPGLTGLPRRPANATVTALSLARASSPPTTPSGHLSCHWADDTPVAAGITTHGPASGMQARSPLHSSAAWPDGAITAIVASPMAPSTRILMAAS